MTSLRSVNRQIAPRSPLISSRIGETLTPRCVAPPDCGISSARRTIGRADPRHSSMTSPSGAALASTSRKGPLQSASGSPSSFRPVGFIVRTSPSSFTTRSPEVRLATISLARRSEASARAFIARSFERSVVSASSMAAAMKAVSVPSERASRVLAFAAAKSFRMANASTAASTATMTVRPRKR